MGDRGSGKGMSGERRCRREAKGREEEVKTRQEVGKEGRRGRLGQRENMGWMVILVTLSEIIE